MKTLMFTARKLTARKPTTLKFTPKLFAEYALATASVLCAALLMLLIGRETLGEAVIGLLYLVPVAWSATRWGQWPGICAAVVAFLTFNFFFIPPYYTFAVGRLESWLLLMIFLIVAVVIVGRIQFGLSQARAREREATHLFELSASLIGLYTRQAIAQTLAAKLQELFQAACVQVAVFPDNTFRGVIATVPDNVLSTTPSQRLLPVLSSSSGLIGEIRIWQAEEGPVVPPVDERLLQTVAAQGALALERAQWTEMTHEADLN